ncbi:MAG TPA: hypothetical protein PKY83_02670 [Bacteroidales bacterium]|jgi:hypothetical protein|nr:hypothetical protein [Bacteroidales bacterium]MCZ2416276.1 hypothetical protein [Burkholderiales bacterium]OQC56937.1 MAG: hypothetical protein BWX52_01363 [Bacteroidetes bacterium ADurb.Bin013]MBP8998709.1 hypothetical protein [Bacteroidales bacterium]MBV6456478.1 hypothetical protein [Bacteroidales bacterium]
MKKLLTIVILPLIIIGLGYAIVRSLTAPIKFDKERDFRSSLAIERLKDIRTLQTTYKTEFGKYASTFDTLENFYKNGTITIVRQIGSFDDSVAVAQGRVFRDSMELPVKDTLLKYPGFNIDSLRWVPLVGEEFEMRAVVKKVSGVDVPLFEACTPFDVLLKGMNRQLIVNLNEDLKISNRYPGIKVGSIDQPNNNAGNWE